MLSPVGGFLYLPDQPRPATGSMELNAAFPGFEFDTTLWICSLDVVLPAFELSGFEITGQGLHIDFPVFKVDFSILGGRNFELDIDFSAFRAAFTVARELSFGIDFAAFETAFKLSKGDQTLTFDAAFEPFTFAAFLRANNVAVEAYEVWVLNQRTKAHSTYSNWPVNSYGKFNGQEIVALSDGLYALETGKDGTDDVVAKVHWVPTDLGSSQQKRIETLGINMRNLDKADIQIMAVVDEQEARYYVKRINSGKTGLRRHRKTMPRGLQGQTWQFGIENQAGGEILLDEVEVLVVELDRQFK